MLRRPTERIRLLHNALSKALLLGTNTLGDPTSIHSRVLRLEQTGKSGGDASWPDSGAKKGDDIHVFSAKACGMSTTDALPGREKLHLKDEEEGTVLEVISELMSPLPFEAKSEPSAGVRELVQGAEALEERPAPQTERGLRSSAVIAPHPVLFDSLQISEGRQLAVSGVDSHQAELNNES